MNFIFEQIRTGGDRNFGYLIGSREKQECVLVDPSYSPEILVERANAQKLKTKWICNTHSHHDHTNGNAEAQKLTGAKVADLMQESELQVGNISIQVIQTPGHCPDHVVLFIPEYGIAITGDHLFVGKIGGTGTEEDAKEQFASFEKLFDILPDATTIWPGHDVGCRPSSTWKLEKMTNPFLVKRDLSSFIEMKRNWAQYKIENGLL